jgi:hypothetical protein
VTQEQKMPTITGLRRHNADDAQVVISLDRPPTETELMGLRLVVTSRSMATCWLTMLELEAKARADVCAMVATRVDDGDDSGAGCERRSAMRLTSLSPMPKG